MANVSTYTMTIPNGSETLTVKPNIYINKELMDGVKNGTIPTSGSNLTWNALLAVLNDSTGVIKRKFYVKTWGGSDVSNPGPFEDLFNNGMTFPALPSGFYDVDLVENKYNTFYFKCARYSGYTAWNASTSSFAGQYNPFYAYVAPSTSQRQISLGVTDTYIVSQMLLSYSTLVITYNVNTQLWSYNISVPADITNNVPQAVLDFFGSSPTPDPEPGPYDGAGETEEGGGDESRQNWDDASDAVTPDALPTKGAMNSGMLKVFSPTETQVLDLTDLLFSYNFFDWLQKNLQNLEELFVSFGVVPFTVTKGATKSVTFLGFDISAFTHPVYLTEAAQQYYEFDMGSIALNGSDARIHASDSVFDYSPFSRLGIYLPFIGFQELDIDECRGNTINLKYRIDIISGSTVALISLNSDDEHCIYQFSGNCLSQIPLGSVDMSGIIAGSINIAVAAASAGVSGAIASAGDSLAESQFQSGGGDLGVDYDRMNMTKTVNRGRVSSAVGNLASATANGIMGMKPNFKHTGAIGSTGGLMAVKQPYLFLTTPREAVPATYQKFCGLPCNITDKLSNFSGYTVVEDIRLNGLVATSSEVGEIYELLKSGVII